MKIINCKFGKEASILKRKYSKFNLSPAQRNKKKKVIKLAQKIYLNNHKDYSWSQALKIAFKRLYD